MANHLLDHHPGTSAPDTDGDTSALLDDLRYHAGLLGCRLAEHPTTPTSTTTDEDVI